MNGSDGSMRYWPSQGACESEGAVETRCDACGQRWTVQLRMAGFRLACDCGVWMDIPWPESETPLLQENPATEGAVVRRRKQSVLRGRKVDPESGLMRLDGINYYLP